MDYASTLTARKGGIESGSLRKTRTPYPGASTAGAKLLEAFPYLGRKMDLRTARRRWGVIAQVPEKTGETVRDRGMMYKAVEKLVLLSLSFSC